MELAYFVTSSTGCTCCSSENRVFGPFKEKAAAESQREFNAQGKRWASQFSSNGRHTLQSTEVEVLPDGRLIIGGSRVVPGWADDEDQCNDPEIGHPDECSFYYNLIGVPG